MREFAGVTCQSVESGTKKFSRRVGKIGRRIFSCEFAEEKKIRKLARMIFAEEFNEDMRKNLKVSSASIMPLWEVLRNNGQIEESENKRQKLFQTRIRKREM